MGKLEGRITVVTGVASGIGAATVKRFAEEGAFVYVADVQDEKGEEIVAGRTHRGACGRCSRRQPPAPTATS